MPYTLMHNMSPVFEHDCDHCEFLGTIEVVHNAMIVDLYACLHNKKAGPDGSIIARYGNKPEENISHPVFRGMICSKSIWAQVASVFADLDFDTFGYGADKLLPGIGLRYDKNSHFSCRILSDSPLFRALMSEPQIGDPVYTNPGEPRTVAEVIGKVWRSPDGRRKYKLRDNTGREFLGLKVIHNNEAIWSRG